MLPARPIVFPSSRAYNQNTNQTQSNQSTASQPASQPTQQSIPQPSQQHSSLPPPTISHSLNPPVPYLPPPNGLGPSQMLNSSAENKSVASTSSVVPGTPQPLTLEQQHITAVDGMVPTLQFVLTNSLILHRDINTYIYVETS